MAVIACSGAQPTARPSPSSLSHKLSTYAYAGYGDEITVITGARAARHRDSAPYMPVEIAVAYRGTGALRLTRESFALIDERGDRYRAAGPRELSAEYDFLDMDRSVLADLPAVARTAFVEYRYYPHKFTPTTSTSSGARTNLSRNTIQLPRFSYLTDFIYFPRPSTGVKGHRFTLLLEPQSLADTVIVVFSVN